MVAVNDRINGPKIKPQKPNKAIPPIKEKMINIGLTFDLPLSIQALIKLSVLPIITEPHNRTKIPR